MSRIHLAAVGILCASCAPAPVAPAVPPLVELMAVPPPPSGGGAPAASPPKRPRKPRPTPSVPAAAPSQAAPAPETPATPTAHEEASVDSAAEGTGNGRGTGVGAAEGPGPGNGPAGPGVGPGGDGPVHLASEKVRVRRMVEPAYPRAATELGLPEARCTVRVVIDDRGRPTAVSVERCSTVFHASIHKAAMQWRFYPAKRAGKRVPATFVVPIRFAP